MSFFVPFNHKPTATGRDGTSYTCPSGKYARVVISYSTAATVSQTSTTVSGATNVSYGVQNDVKTGSVEIWIKAGDAITYTASTASASAAIAPGGAGMYYGAANDFSRAILKLNTNPFAEFRAYASASISGSFTGAGSHTFATFGGNTEVNIYYEEYNVIA